VLVELVVLPRISFEPVPINQFMARDFLRPGSPGDVLDNLGYREVGPGSTVGEVVTDRSIGMLPPIARIQDDMTAACTSSIAARPITYAAFAS
jgi:hypothetical protein